MTPKEQVLDAMQAYRTDQDITGDDLIQIAIPGEDLWDEWCAAQGMSGDPTTSVIALRVEGFGAFYATVDAAIEDLDTYYPAEVYPRPERRGFTKGAIIMEQLVSTLLADLTEDGLLFMTHMRTLHGAPLTHISTDDDDLTTPLIRLISELTHSERMRRFGVECLPSSRDASGSHGPQGHPIPTEDYIHRVVTCYGDAPERRTISLDPYIRRVRRGQMSLAQALNAAGKDLREMLTEGQYRIA